MPDTFTKSQRSRIMAAVPSRDTTPEMVVRRIVHSLGFRFRLHDKNLPGCPDIVLRRHKKIIDVRGCFWHLHNCDRCRIPADNREYWITKLERNARRDRRVLRQLHGLGWRCLVVWECQTKTTKRDLLRKKLSAFLSDAL